MAFVDWLHEKGYTFNSSGRIGDLTSGQLALLQGGHTFREQKREEQMEDVEHQGSRTKYSRSKTRQKARELAENRAFN